MNMASINDDFDLDSFKEGDAVAVIDCMTFVPEYIPVLKALEMQHEQTLPFNDGDLLNFCKSRPADLSNTIDLSFNLADKRGLVRDMVLNSGLQPIIELRRDDYLTDNLVNQLVQLVESATLDRGQLVSFLNSLRNPVHCTQGPPGTGKSYLGVVIVRALMIVRSLWLQHNRSAGLPPILVLSYKNHAIDEFLVDLVNAESRSLQGSLIRIGGSASSGDPR